MPAVGRSLGVLSRSYLFPALRDCCSFILAALLSQHATSAAAILQPWLGYSEPQILLPVPPPHKDPRSDDKG